MKTAIVMSGIALALTLHSPAAAQMVEAGVVIRSGPVAGHVVVVDRYAPRVVVVEYVRAPHRHSDRWWRRHGYREVVLFYDVRRDRFYDRWNRDRRGIREVIVYERHGRFYSPYEYRRDDRRRDGDWDYRDRDDDEG